MNRLVLNLLIALAGLSLAATSMESCARQPAVEQVNSELSPAPNPEAGVSVAGTSMESSAPQPAVEQAKSERSPVPKPESNSVADSTDDFGGGTEVCVRCGAVREVRLTSDKPRYDPTASAEQVWAEGIIGACTEHDWRHTGCWFSRGARTSSVSCSMLADEHLLWKALMTLEAEHAKLMVSRFVTLPQERQVELWRDANRQSRYPKLSENQLARRIANAAGWSDLATFWSE